jgi:NAD-dependent DNA ligase
MDTANIVTLLKKASDAYYNGETPVMDDETYDSLLEKLRELDPSNEYLATVGALPPPENAVALPFKMPSLDKIKPGQPFLQKFLGVARSYVFSEKLDGLSALWCPNKQTLYLRGDGRTGQQVNHLTQMKGLIPSKESFIIRGEILIPRADVEPGQIARTIVNGLVHRKQLDASELQRLRFVAYEVLVPTFMKRADQMKWLEAHGYETPWWEEVTGPTEQLCAQRFQQRRTTSIYDIDGIVVGLNQAPHHTGDPIGTEKPPVKNPKDCVAFKMPLSDQSAITTVREVIWAPSAQGYLIPRLRFDPVKIGGASIEFCTGHNARTIVANRIGPGSQVKIRRSGDVIPTLDTVLIQAQEPSLPPSSSWEWVGDSSTAIHIHLMDISTEQIVSQLLHFSKTLSIPGLGPASCKTLVENGVKTPKLLWNTSAERLSTILGPKSGKILHAELRKAVTSPTLSEVTLLVASSRLPRATGATKLSALIKEHPDPRTWAGLKASAGASLPGWTESSFQTFQTMFKSYEPWRLQEFDWIPYPLLSKGLTETVAAGGPLKTVCFTGFRDAALEKTAAEKGFTTVDTVSSKLSILVVPDGPVKQSEKVKKAQALGTVELLQRSDFVRKYIA